MTRWEVIRPCLTSEEQVNFIAAYIQAHPHWAQEDLNSEAKGDYLKPHIVLRRSFGWENSPNGYLYWECIYNRIKSQWEGGKL